MFPSNPSPQIPCSIHVSPPLGSFSDHEKYDYFIHQEHNSNPFVPMDCFFNAYTSIAPPPPVIDYIAENKPDLVGQQLLHEGYGFQYCDDYNDLLESIVYPYKKKTVACKKLGHSKIYTAQGPRDRRVRLSIDIARKFFVLQNLLGFDKASKTLDWLFTKSKTAIKELVEETKHSSSSTLSTEQCELAFLEEDNKGHKKSENKFLDGKKQKMTQKHKSGFHVGLARDQARAVARARARERTKEKLRIKKLQDELKNFPDGYTCHALTPSNITTQSSFWGQIQSQSDYNDILQESIVEQRFSM